MKFCLIQRVGFLTEFAAAVAIRVGVTDWHREWRSIGALAFATAKCKAQFLRL